MNTESERVNEAIQRETRFDNGCFSL